MLAVVGGKGGCGKTTTALGLATALARQHRRPLVCEADVDMPNLDVVASVPATPGADELAAGASLPAVTHASDRWAGVDVVPATAGANVADALAALAAARPDRPTLVDCPAGAGPDVATPLRAVDRALVVTTPHPPSVTDARKTADLSRALGTRVAGVVCVRCADPPERVRRGFQAPLVGCVPEATSPLSADGVRAAYARLAGALWRQQKLSDRRDY